jgi:hypothetical protein
MAAQRCPSCDMKTRIRYFCLLAGLLLGAPARAEQWFAVASPGADGADSRVEVDLETVRVRSRGGEGAIRVTFDLLQPHSAGFRYRSFVANAQFDCQRHRITLTSAEYFSQAGGKGSLLGADSSSREVGVPPAVLDSIPASARRALLRATCATTRPAPE